MKHRRVVEEKALFQDVFREFSDTGVIDFARCYMLFTQARRVIRENIKGDFAEVGVYRGNTAQLILQCCGERTLHLFDTFEGHPDNARPEYDGNEYVKHVRKNRLCDTSLAAVQSRLGKNSNITYHKGYFPDSAKALLDDVFAFVHLDADQYQTTKDGCEFFFPRLSVGGVLICHDYGIYEGVKIAIDEYFSESGQRIIEVPDAMGSVCVIKH